MSRILLVEDDPVLGRSLSLNFEMEGYRVTWARDLKSALAASEGEPPDLIVLDLELPDGSGLALCSRLREKGATLPILILTARGDEDSAVEGLSAGANDYVRKPFGNRELLARIRVALKESAESAEKLRFGDLLLLTGQRRALWRGQEIDLNRRELDVLTTLARRPGAVVSREMLLETFAKDAEIFDRTIDSHVSHLRTKLRQAGARSLRIASVYGVGYRLEQV